MKRGERRERRERRETGEASSTGGAVIGGGTVARRTSHVGLVRTPRHESAKSACTAAPLPKSSRYLVAPSGPSYEPAGSPTGLPPSPFV